MQGGSPWGNGGREQERGREENKHGRGGWREHSNNYSILRTSCLPPNLPTRPDCLVAALTVFLMVVLAFAAAAGSGGAAAAADGCLCTTSTALSVSTWEQKNGAETNNFCA